MIKSELIQQIAAANPHLYQRDVERIINVILDEITDALARGDRVELRGFGAFSVKHRAGAQGRNPRTGDTVFVDGQVRALLQDRQGAARAPQPRGWGGVRPRPDGAAVMRKLVAALIVVPIGVLLVALAVVNRKPVMLGLNPFDANAGLGVEAPCSCSCSVRLPLGSSLAGSRAGSARASGGKWHAWKPARPRLGAARPTASRRSLRLEPRGQSAFASPRVRLEPPRLAAKHDAHSELADD